MTIEDFPGDVVGVDHMQLKYKEKVDDLQIDIEPQSISYSETNNGANQYAISSEPFNSAEQDYEHAALQAWCSLMNAYLEDVSTQRKSELLKEWQNAEQRLIEKKRPKILAREELN